jgi:hypothetical protein
MYTNDQMFQQEAAQAIIYSRSRRAKQRARLRLDRLTAALAAIGMLVIFYWLTYPFPYAEDQWLGAIAFALMLPFALTRGTS